METAQTVILDALKEIVAIPAEASIDAYKAQVGIFYLNAMMMDFSVNGINLGYTLVDSLGDKITVPDSALEAIVKNLAVIISPVFKAVPTSQKLFDEAEEGYKTLLNVSNINPSRSPYSETLPRGSGNWGYDFYDRIDTPLLTEQGVTIGVESVS